MKTLNIEIPSGYEIDLENSNLKEGKVVFKEAKKGLPKTWEELKSIEGYFVDSYSRISDYEGGTRLENRNTFPTNELAEASIAMAQLSQLREVYRQGWKPNWEDMNENKYVIKLYKNKPFRINSYCIGYFLSFQSAEIRDEFLNNFRDLIESAKPLLS